MTVLFDEAHSEAWTIRSELASAMQPAHPGDSSYARAAAALLERGFDVVPNIDGPLTTERLKDCELLVIALQRGTAEIGFDAARAPAVERR